MDSVGLWSAPLLLIPGVGLLILSTSARFGRLHDEFHRLKNLEASVSLQNLLTRARLIKNALIALYLSIVILAISSLTGSFLQHYHSSIQWVAECMAAFAILSLTYASAQLVRESLRLFEIFEYD